jgi:S1-C subfamily serine protease
MTEEEKDAATGDPVESSETGAAPIELPATTPPPPTPVQAETPAESPAATPALPSDLPQAPPLQESQPDTPPMGAPVQPQTPPQGVPQTEGPAGQAPTGSYAMGALAGNPMLGTPSSDPSAQAGAPYTGAPNTGAPNAGAPYTGAPYGVPYGGVPYAAGAYGDPAAAGWAAPPAPTPTSAGAHRLRTAALIGGAALAALGLGVGLGHITWAGPTRSLNAAPTFGSGWLPFRTNPNNGNGGTSPFGNGGGSIFGNSGNTGNSGSSGSSGNSGGSGGSGNSGSSNSSGPSDAGSIASKVDPGLVDVNTTLGYSGEQAAGTGIVLTSNGVILTNNHVIDGATTISVTDVGNGKTYTASVVGYDRTKDVAVIQLHNASGLQTANLGDSSSASVGQDVVGVGNAGGTGGTPSAAGGTITALNQSITASDQGDGTSEQLSGLIQTNANIQPGDSGGALVNDQGQVLGMDTAASAGFQFQFNNGNQQGTEGFAIPINAALNIAHEIENGQASSTIHIGTTAFLGVEINPGSSSSSSGGGGGGNGFGGIFGNSGNTGNSGSGANVAGASVAGTVTNGPAQEAGLAQGDVITSLGGRAISSANDLTSAMGIYHPGDKVQVGWTDGNGKTHTATVQLSSGPPQ